MLRDNRSGDPAEIAYEEEEDPSVWVTRDGTRIPIQEMSDQHLSNAAKHLQKKSDEMDASGYEMIPTEDARRMEAEYDDLREKVKWLEIEQERRKK